jgi:hypothetical protein
MYEDDGESYEFENGAVSCTLFECKPDKKGFSIVANPVSGSFEGMPSERNYTFEIRSLSKPKKVFVNGEKSSGWTWEGDVLTVPAGKVAVSEITSVNIQY